MEFAFDRTELRTRIRHYYSSESEFAEDMGISNVTLSRKMNGGSFTDREIRIMIDLLEIGARDIGRYFFNNKGIEK